MTEAERLKDLESYDLLDSIAEKEFNNMVELASAICEMPISLITLLDKNRQWFKANVGLNTTETPREVSFCHYALQTPNEILIVKDPLNDERFKNNPFVTGYPNIRYYAGVPLVTPNGNVLGTLCVMDSNARELSEGKLKALKILADKTTELFEQRKKEIRLLQEKKQAKEELGLYKRAIESSSDGIFICKADAPLNPIIFANEAFCKITGYTLDEVKGKNASFLFGKETNQAHIDNLRKSLSLNHACSVEMINYKKDGTTFQNLVSLSPIFHSRYKATHFLVIMKEITEKSKI